MERWLEYYTLFGSKRLNPFDMNSLIDFEIQTGIILPDEYKNYCQVFGDVVFGNEIQIYCPPSGESSNTIGHIAQGVSLFVQDKELCNQMLSLLSKSLIFADTGCGGIFIWDLGSWSDNDRNYDIHYFNTDDIEEYGIRKVGRDFLEFFEKYIINNSIEGFLVEDDYYPPEGYRLEFTEISMITKY